MDYCTVGREPIPTHVLMYAIVWTSRVKTISSVEVGDWNICHVQLIRRSVGRILTLSLTVDQGAFECNTSILKPFVPFAKSQVLLVELQPHISGISSLVILKVYDPRFINDRERSGEKEITKNKTSERWTWSNEDRCAGIPSLEHGIGNWIYLI